MLDRLWPALRNGGTTLSVELRPGTHLLDVGNSSMIVIAVERLDKVQVINDLRAHSAMSTAKYRNRFSTSLQCGTRIFHSKGTHAHNHHILPRPFHLHQLVSRAIRNNPLEFFHTLTLQRPRNPN